MSLDPNEELLPSLLVAGILTRQREHFSITYCNSVINSHLNIHDDFKEKLSAFFFLKGDVVKCSLYKKKETTLL